MIFIDTILLAIIAYFSYTAHKETKTTNTFLASLSDAEAKKAALRAGGQLRPGEGRERLQYRIAERSK